MRFMLFMNKLICGLNGSIVLLEKKKKKSKQPITTDRVRDFVPGFLTSVSVQPKMPISNQPNLFFFLLPSFFFFNIYYCTPFVNGSRVRLKKKKRPAFYFIIYSFWSLFLKKVDSFMTFLFSRVSPP